ncbi:MAG: VCBS repeat-containing protein [Deltaproteobacteria bacterium]|nr:VCBS repeat-containing protein [Deltaproteobacteria bacterium]MBW2074201.1 VCBS repeat-containing protein [Deltaproteobacteria bacterium]
MILRKVIRIFFIIFLLAVFQGGAWAGEPSRVAIIPFKMNADRDLSFLREGIVDMLTTRLSWENKVVVIEREVTERIVGKIAGAGPMNEKVAREIGTALHADYVLFGSLTVFGESVSIDAKMMDVHGAKPVVTIFNQSRGMDNVIPKINVFASDINEKVFGRVLTIREEAPRQVASRAPFPDIYAHPEKLLGEGIQEYGGMMETSGLNPNFIAVGGRRDAGSFWKSRNFEEHIKGMSIGDIDGDGHQEVVFISQNQIFVYRNVERRFIKVKEISGEPNDNFIGVDVADINGNGKAEIFVTNLNTLRDVLQSFVLEWEAGDFVTISKGNNWYYRVIELPMQGPVLLGQKRGLSDPFLGDIYELGWRNGNYEGIHTMDIPRGVNVFAFTIGDVLDDGQEMILAFDENDYLQILTRSGAREWKSDEYYGGSVNYLEMASENEPSEKGRLFLAQRIFIKDLDRDGKKEVIVIKNHAGTSRLFKRYRQFSSSEIVSLSWNGLGLGLNWKTRKIHGYVSDFAIGDFDNDGQEELVAAVVMEQGASFVAKAKSTIISYDLAIPKT